MRFVHTCPYLLPRLCVDSMVTPFRQARELILHRTSCSLVYLLQSSAVWPASSLHGDAARAVAIASPPQPRLRGGGPPPIIRPPASEPVNITKIAKGPGALSARCVAAPGPQCSSASAPSWQDGRLPPGQRGGLGAWLAMEFQSSRRGPGWRAAPSPRAHAASSAGPCRSRNLTGRSRSLRPR